MCKDTHVSHKFLFRMFITYLIYTIVTNIKVKRVAEKLHLQNASNVLIAVLNLLLGKLCCFVVKPNKLKVRCQGKYNCKLRYFKNLHYFTTIEHELQKVQCIHI